MLQAATEVERARPARAILAVLAKVLFDITKNFILILNEQNKFAYKLIREKNVNSYNFLKIP